MDIFSVVFLQDFLVDDPEVDLLLLEGGLLEAQGEGDEELRGEEGEVVRERVGLRKARVGVGGVGKEEVVDDKVDGGEEGEELEGQRRGCPDRDLPDVGALIRVGAWWRKEGIVERDEDVPRRIGGARCRVDGNETGGGGGRGNLRSSVKLFGGELGGAPTRTFCSNSL